VNYEKIKIVNFVQQYMSVIENYIELFESKSFGLKSNDESYQDSYNEMIESISDFRGSDEVKSYLKSEGLGSDWLDVVNKDKISTLSKVMNELYGSENLPGSRNKSKFITTLFFKNSDLDKEILEKYIEKINDFTLDKDINALYNFAFLNSNDESNIIKDNDSKMKKHLTSIFKGLEKKDRAEIISSLNVFLEIYEKTDFGSKHISLINKKYQEDLKKGNSNAQIEWLDNILEAASSCSPSKLYNSINYLDNTQKGKMIKRTESGGKVDGLFFINSTKYGEELLKELNDIKNLKELKEFEQKYKDEEQIMICATSDKSLDIEKDTIVRHPLANMFLSNLLNSEMKKDNYFMLNFNNNIRGAFKDGNVNIRNAIVKAFRSLNNTEILDIKDDRYDSEDAYNKIQSKILKNPVKYINEDINKNLDLINENRVNNGLEELEPIKKMTLLTKEYFDEYSKLHQEDGVFNSHSYVCFFQKGNVHKSRKVEEKGVNIKKIKELDKEEKVALIQYAALVKTIILKEDTEISINLCNKFADKCLKLRCFSDKNTLKNSLFDDIKTNDIDAYVLETFILSDDFEKNKKFLDNNLKKNTSKIIDHVLKEYNKCGEDGFLKKYNIEPEKLFNRIEYILENDLNIFHQDIKSNIRTSLEMRNKDIEMRNKDIERNNQNKLNEMTKDIRNKIYRTNENLNVKETALLERIEEMGLDSFEVTSNDLFKDEIVLNILKMSDKDILNYSHYDGTTKEKNEDEKKLLNELREDLSNKSDITENQKESRKNNKKINKQKYK
tara:strand:+ start:992 stop:3340 length:2349 start_codon:yes stop_codon:yes gene_type:complete